MSSDKRYNTHETPSKSNKRYTIIGPRTGGFLVGHRWVAVSSIMHDAANETLVFPCSDTGRVDEWTEIDNLRPRDHDEMVRRWSEPR